MQITTRQTPAFGVARLALAAAIELDTQWGGFKNLFGSEGGFIALSGLFGRD